MDQKTGYKKTKIGWIPEDWDVIPLIDLSKSGITNGVFNDPKKVGSGYRLINVVNLYSEPVIKINDLKRLDINGKEFSKFKVEKGDIFFTRSSLKLEGIAHCNIYDEDDEDIVFECHIMRIRPNKKIAVPHYLKSYFIGQSARKFFMARAKQITMTTISQADIANIPVPIPPMHEQKKIAEILTTVDNNISSIENQIQQSEQVKKGLMEKLLTEGVGHMEFKDTKIGRMPTGWNVVNINTISNRKSGHTPNRKIPEYWNGGIKWVSLADTYRLDTLYLNETDHNISEEGINNSSAVKLKKGAVIISRDAGVGKSTIINDVMAVSQHFIAWECGETLFNEFLFYLLQKWKGKFERIANGTTIKTIGLDFFKKMEIPHPPIEEQKQIASILSIVDSKIEVLSKKKSQYQTLKKGLSQQLLTGQMRVKV